jgi:hypothetical protein
MPRIIHILWAVALLGLVLPQPAQANSNEALQTLARTYGFTYQWIVTEAAVRLSRPGVTVLIRAGNPRMAINDRLFYLTDVPVEYSNELYVSSQAEEALRELADEYPLNRRVIVLSPPAAPATGALTLKIAYAEGAESILASGHGPAGVPVSIVLKAEISRDLPTITIGRANVQTDDDGAYTALIPAASMGFVNSVLVATVSSRGLTPVTVVGPVSQANTQLHTGTEALPKEK